jgi:NAD(P)H dehydrogenase (quinone)
VLLQENQAGKVHELGGDEAFTLSELAEEIADASGQPVKYQDLPFEQYAKVLADAGLPEPYAAILADSDLGIARGDLLVSSGDLSRLIGRPATPMRTVVPAAVGAVLEADN